MARWLAKLLKTGTMVAVAIGCATTGDSSFAQIPCSYEVAAVIQGPPGPNHESPTVATAISPDGQHVVGYYRFDAIGDPRPWYWSPATGLILLPLPPGFYSASPADINNSRVIVGTGLKPNTGSRGYMYDMASGAFTEFAPLPGGVWSFATGINEAGTVCGTRSIGSKTDPVNPQTAFIWMQKDGFTDLGLLNGTSTAATCIAESGEIVGTMGQDNVLVPFLWDDSGVQALGSVSPGLMTTPLAVNASLAIVGRATVPYAAGGVVPQGFRWNNGEFVQLGTLPGHARSTANDVSVQGLIVGMSRPYTGAGDRAFVYDDEGPMVNLNDRVAQPVGFALEEGLAISDAGMIVAFGSSRSVVLQPIKQEGDANGDCKVDVADFLFILAHWGTGGGGADLNGDGMVNIWDLFVVISNWG